jgi:hypothetical protein
MHTDNSDLPNTPQDTQPSWLERLAAESWQAEMVISGAAIFGSFQLFGMVNNFIGWCYFHLPGSFMQIAYFLCFYLLIAVSVLSMSFLGHFIIRSIWIAGIGLESVYPEIKRENDTYTPHFMDQLLARFPSFKAFNEELDRVGSSILAHALMFVMTFVGIGIMISVVLLLGIIAALFVSEETAAIVSIGLLALLMLITFVNAFLNSKSMNNRPWVQKIHFPITLFIGKLVTSVFYRPYTYFSFAIRTNVKPKQFWKFMVVLMVGVLLISINTIGSTHLFALQSDVYERYDLRTDRMYSSNYYEEEANSELAFIRPQIPAQVLHHTADLKLFLPMPEREERKLFLACSETEPEGIEDRDQARTARYNYRLTCFREQLEIEIDGLEITNYILKVYRHPHASEPGLQYFFPGLELTSGEHVLTIRHLAVAGEQVKVDHVPFIYLPK